MPAKKKMNGPTINLQREKKLRNINIAGTRTDKRNNKTKNSLRQDD